MKIMFMSILSFSPHIGWRQSMRCDKQFQRILCN